MRLLLTSAGVRNARIHDALLDLLGRPIADCTALCIPTAMYGHPYAGPGENARVSAVLAYLRHTGRIP